MGQPIKLSIVASFINIHITILNWYYVTVEHDLFPNIKVDEYVVLLSVWMDNIELAQQK